MHYEMSVVIFQGIRKHRIIIAKPKQSSKNNIGRLCTIFRGSLVMNGVTASLRHLPRSKSYRQPTLERELLTHSNNENIASLCLKEPQSEV